MTKQDLDYPDCPLCRGTGEVLMERYAGADL